MFGKGDGVLVQLPLGKFYYLDPNGKESKKLVYKECSISIRKTAVQFNYELCINQINDEALESDAEMLEDSEASFLIDQCLLFRINGKRMTWADLADEKNKCQWEFIVSDANSVTMDLFEETIVSCMFERAHQKPHDSATDLEMTTFLNKLKLTDSSPVPVQKKAQQFETPTKNVPRPAAPRTPQTPLVATPIKMRTEIDLPVGTSVLLVQAGLYIFDSSMGSFVPYLPKVHAELRQTDKFEYSLVIFNENMPVICQPVEQRMNTFADQSHLSFIWVWYDEDTQLPAISWCIKFDADKSADYNAFNELFKSCLYETVNRAEFKSQQQKDWEYVNDIIQDIDMEVDDDEEEEEDYDEQERAHTSRGASVPDDGENNPGDNSKNSLLAVGYKHDRSFVVRGNKIGVFKHTDDNDLEFSTTIKYSFFNQQYWNRWWTILLSPKSYAAQSRFVSFDDET